jgi:hypothetical protein
LIVYDEKKDAVWLSQTPWLGTPGYELVLENDGNLILYDSKGNSLWKSSNHKNHKKGRFCIKSLFIF